MRKIINVAAIVIVSTFLLLLIPFSLFVIALWESASWPGDVIHKTMNYGEYSIVIISRVNFPRFLCNRKLYAEVWSNRDQVHNYFITRLDAPDEFDIRIKDITILPDTGEIRVECDHCFRDRSVSGVELYKIAETEAAAPVVTVP